MEYETNPHLSSARDQALSAQCLNPETKLIVRWHSLTYLLRLAFSKPSIWAHRKRKTSRMKCYRCRLASDETSEYLAGLHSVVIELVLLCNDASPGWGRISSLAIAGAAVPAAPLPLLTHMTCTFRR